MLSSESPVPTLLGELKLAHSNLLRAIADLDRITSGPPPEEDALASARLAVSRTSLARRLLWGRILARLAPVARGRDEADLRLIQDCDIQLLKATVNHVAAWKPADAIERWRTYAAGESHVLQKLAGIVALEKSLLYPMLEARAPVSADAA
jgi:hypothetical protein